MGIRKSDFTAKSDVVDTDTFDFVSNGQNFKIPAVDFIAALGFVGSIIQKGEITGQPVLNKNGLMSIKLF